LYITQQDANTNKNSSFDITIFIQHKNIPTASPSPMYYTSESGGKWGITQVRTTWPEDLRIKNCLLYYNVKYRNCCSLWFKYVFFAQSASHEHIIGSSLSLSSYGFHFGNSTAYYEQTWNC
jgi:hypothetical protein